jgi:hypothetical protein
MPTWASATAAALQQAAEQHRGHVGGKRAECAAARIDQRRKHHGGAEAEPERQRAGGGPGGD